MKTRNRKTKGVSLVSPSKYLSTTDFIAKLAACRNHKAIVHVETDFGMVVPVLMVWDESMHLGDGDESEVGTVTLAYGVRIDDPRCAETMRPYSVEVLLERLGRVKNHEAVIHSGGYELTGEPITSIADDTWPVNEQGEVGAVIIT